MLIVVDFVSYVVYYETIKRELNRILIYECRCDERLKAKDERSTRLTYTGLISYYFSLLDDDFITAE